MHPNRKKVLAKLENQSSRPGDFGRLLATPAVIMITDTVTDAPHQQRVVWRVILRTALIVIALTAIVFAIVHCALKARETAKRFETTNNFKQIALALQNVHDTYKRLPHPVRHADGVDSPFVVDQDPKAKQLYSWRFAIIPCIASYKMDAAFDQSWTAPANTRWRTVPQPYAYDGWGDGVFDRRNPASVPNITRAFAITGSGTAFGDGHGEKPRSLDEIDADTILVVEIRNSGIHWMAPGDFDIRTMPKTINDPNGRGISSSHGSGFHVVFADGAVWYRRNDVPFDQLAKFFTVTGAKANDRDKILGPHLHD